MSGQNLLDELKNVIEDDENVILVSLEALVTGTGGNFGNPAYQKMSSILREIFRLAREKHVSKVDGYIKELRQLIEDDERAAPVALEAAVYGHSVLGGDSYQRMKIIFREVFDLSK